MKFIITLIASCIMISCSQEPVVKKKITIRNKNNYSAEFIPEGARLISFTMPDKNGKPTGIVIGFDSAAQYAASTEPYFGATIGRYGNRIKGGKFSLNGQEHQITINNGPNALHGGKNGFQSKLWTAEQPDEHTVVFSLVSPDGDEGFPGKLDVKVTYTLTDNNELKMDYEATTDKATVVNLTNHAFWNLNGEGSGTVDSHLVHIDADTYLPVDSTLIPLGKAEAVAGTPFDFKTPTTIGQRINEPHVQLLIGKGYDHNFVLNGTGMREVASALGDRSGIFMQVYTIEPGMQFYSGNFMQGKNQLRSGPDDFRTAFCFETQHYPDSPNQPGFPGTVLEPGKTYRTSSVYAFSVKK
ncbi:MAG: galactose mutarotase [Chitinophagaceae bacterium]|nr:galactose mutarotase [Chitinophagaceae bacterium]